jgi:hypothetical protein
MQKKTNKMMLMEATKVLKEVTKEINVNKIKGETKRKLIVIMNTKKQKRRKTMKKVRWRKIKLRRNIKKI